MELVVDGRTMAVCGVSGVPVTDIALVFGDRVILSVLVEHVDMECRPVLAVKKSLGSDDLVMAVTEWNLGSDGRWVADLVVNTVPLQECFGDASRVELVGEIVLMEADGAQHSSRVFGVLVRRDILGDDVVPPEEVVRDWGSMAEDALRGPLEDAVAEVRAAGAEGVEMAGRAEQYAVQALNAKNDTVVLNATALECAQRAEAAAGEAQEAAGVVGEHADVIMSTTVPGHAKLGTAKVIGADGGMVGKSATDQLIVVPAATGYAGAVKLAVNVGQSGSSVPVSGQVYGAIQHALGEALTSYSIAEQAMGAGTFNTEFNWCEWSGERIEGGELAGIDIPCRTNASALMTTSPVFLSVWQADAAGVWVHLGFSLNAVAQSVNETGHWLFAGVSLEAGRAVRVCAVPDFSRQWVTSLVLGGRRSAATDGSKIELSGGSYSYAIDATFSVKVEEESRFAEAGSLVAAVDARLRELGQVFLNLSPSEVTVPCDGGTVSIVVHTNAEGPVKHNGAPMSSNVLTVKVGANLYAYKNTARSGFIQVGSLSKEYVIVQEAGAEYLEVTPTSLSVPAEGGEFWVKVVYNTSKTPEWAVDIPWAEMRSGMVNNGSSWERPSNTHFFTAAANDTGEVRSGIITVTLNGQSQTCVVTQDAE